MKVVDVCGFYAPQGGGVRTYVEQKLRLGSASGHEIVIIAPGPERYSEHRGSDARIEWIPGRRFPLDRRYHYFSEIEPIYDLLEAEQPDLVEASSPWRTARIVADWPGDAPRSLIMHADPAAAYAYRWLEGLAEPDTVDRSFPWFWRRLRDIGSRFDVVISANHNLSGRLAAHGIAHVVTNPLGVEANLFSPLLRDEGLRERMLARCALPPDGTLLIGVGRHGAEKRWPLVIDAVTAAGIERPVGLIIVGDGRERGRVTRQVASNPHIQLLSPIVDRRALARLMASCDALIHGCEAETFSIVVAEAAASGLPLIVPDRGAAADHAQAGRDFIYKSGTASDAAHAIAALLDSPRDVRRGAVRTMADHFSGLFELYQQLSRSARLAA
jgi:alpha-1,6-mannosyltransferase